MSLEGPKAIIIQALFILFSEDTSSQIKLKCLSEQQNFTKIWKLKNDYVLLPFSLIRYKKLNCL